VSRAKRADGRTALKKLTESELRHRVQKIFGRNGVATSVNNWPPKIDQALNQEPELQSSALHRLIADLSPRWVDIYLQELGVRIEGLQADRRTYADLNARFVSVLVDQYEFDGAEAIHNDEVKAGWYSYVSDASAAEVDAQMAWFTSVDKVNIRYGALLADPDIAEAISDPRRTAVLQASVARASFYSPYTKTHVAQTTHPGSPEEEFDYLWIDTLLDTEPGSPPSPPAVFVPVEGQMYPNSPGPLSEHAFHAS
jgi:hypothetical protein